MNKRKLVALTLATCCLSLPSYAQIRMSGKSSGKPVIGKSQLAHKIVAQGHTYHPVFGYTAPRLSKDVATAIPVTSSKVHQLPFGPKGRLIQTAPILNPTTEPLKYLSAFTHTKNITASQMAEGLYLYRLANPAPSAENPYLEGLLQQAKDFSGVDASGYLFWLEDAPAVSLLARLQDPAFAANSYAELAARFSQYPKHVTLNAEGIPVATEQADTVRLLDTYLMLSNPQEFGKFNNTKQGEKYTPFTLTPEERAAANELASARKAAEAIPNNPTPRDLIEIAYNRLESHTIPYTQAETVGAGYQAYPNYKNTYLYRAIKGMIEGQEPIVTIEVFTSLENKDITHLIVLDAVMGGIESNDWSGLGRALRAFDAFSASLKETPENIEYVRILQQNLRIVFTPVVNQYRNIPRNPKEARGTDVRWDAVWLLERYKAGELVGRDFRQESHYF